MQVKNKLKKLKVCQLCAVDFSLKHFLVPLIDGMDSCGWSVTAVCSEGYFISELREKGYRIKTIPISRSFNPILALRSLALLVIFFRKERFDIVHVHTPIAAFIGRIAAWLTGVKIVIYSAHGFYFHNEMPNLKRQFFIALERFSGFFTDLLFCQSAEDADDAISNRIISASRVFTIGNGVNIKNFNPEKINVRAMRDSLGIPIDAYVVGIISRQVREKGIVEFLSALTKLADKHPRLWVLVVGERLPSDHDKDVESELAKAKTIFSQRLIATGFRDDIPELLSVMDLFCLPSWREGMPRTIIEAMMMAKPVLATNIRGSREEVIANKTGILVPIKDAQSIAEAISFFIENPEKSLKMGIQGRVRALKYFNESRVVNYQIEIICHYINTFRNV
ncbi:RfaG Glycosyltransferase [Candidatus Methylopumilus universalis]|uniref:glycosyltransferase family 4 protein n=1 Tax=Candidatus Methylopumilus universalis TaxID=2588536 RepID=UPI003BEEF191